MTEKDPFDEIVDILREPADLPPDLTRRVMAEIATLPPHAAPLQVAWWRRGWTVRLTPVRAVALAAGLAALVLAAGAVGRRTAPAGLPVAASATSPGDLMMQFVFVAPEANTVSLVGDFNDWSDAATPLVRAAGDGVWHVTVPLAPGRYRYAFIVDGKVWRSDPEASALEDEFGRPNSVVTVGGA